MVSRKKLRKYGWGEDRRDGAIPDVPKPSPGKKDTKRWCKGKVGREHTPEITLRHNLKCYPMPEWAKGLRFYRSKLSWWCHHERICTTCGKVLDWSIEPDECPDLP